MKKILTGFLLTVILGISVFAQAEQQSTFETLIAEVASSKAFADVEAALDKAKDLYSKNARKARGNRGVLAKEKLGFALFRKAVVQKINPDGKTGMFPKGGGKEFLKFYRNNFEELTKLFEGSIDIYEKELRIETVELATAKFELARTNENNFLDKNASSHWDMHIERYRKNQDLYLGAFVIREKLLGKLDDMVLVTAFYLANSYVRSSDFERALTYYEKFVEGFRAKYERNSKNLLPALYMSGSIWKLAENEEAVEKIAKEITEITKKETDFKDSSLLLSPRATSFKHKGINPVRAGGFVERQTGITSSGQVVDVGSMNEIQRRQTANQSPVRILGQGSSSFKRANIVRVFVRVDTNGEVVWLKAVTKDPKIKKKIESKVKKWKFKPFVLEDKPLTMNGFVNYYDLKEIPIR